MEKKCFVYAVGHDNMYNRIVYWLVGEAGAISCVFYPEYGDKGGFMGHEISAHHRNPHADYSHRAACPGTGGDCYFEYITSTNEIIEQAWRDDPVDHEPFWDIMKQYYESEFE